MLADVPRGIRRRSGLRSDLHRAARRQSARPRAPHRPRTETSSASQHYAEAYQAFSQATQLAPSNPDGWSGLAFAASKTSRPAQVIQALTARTQLLPDNPSTYFLWATSYDAMHNRANAVSYYHRFSGYLQRWFPGSGMAGTPAAFRCLKKNRSHARIKTGQQIRLAHSRKTAYSLGPRIVFRRACFRAHAKTDRVKPFKPGWTPSSRMPLHVEVSHAYFPSRSHSAHCFLAPCLRLVA